MRWKVRSAGSNNFEKMWYMKLTIFINEKLEISERNLLAPFSWLYCNFKGTYNWGNHCSWVWKVNHSTYTAHLYSLTHYSALSYTLYCYKHGSALSFTIHCLVLCCSTLCYAGLWKFLISENCSSRCHPGVSYVFYYLYCVGDYWNWWIAGLPSIIAFNSMLNVESM